MLLRLLLFLFLVTSKINLAQVCTADAILGEWTDEKKEVRINCYKENGKYVNDKPDSLWKRYYMPKEKLRFEGRFLNGDEDGKHTWYFQDGRIMTDGNYIGGMKQGEWKFYYDNGFNYLTITYENDIETKFQGIKVTPTYEESLRDYSSIYNKKADKTILDKDKKVDSKKNENKDEE